MAEAEITHAYNWLAAGVADLLSRDLTPADVPALRYALEKQAALVDRLYHGLEKQKALIDALVAQLNASGVLDEDDAPPWETPDDRRW